MTRQPDDWQYYSELRDRFFDKYPDDSIGPELQSLILDDPDKKSDFVAHLHMMAALPLELGRQDHQRQGAEGIFVHFNPTQADSPVATAKASVESHRLSRWQASLAIGTAVAAAVFLFPTFFSRFPSVQGLPPIAYLNSAENCLWGQSTLPTEVGSQLNAGRLRLISGSATLVMSNTQLVLEGPVDLELISPTRCRLHGGRVVMTSKNGGDGLVIRVPNGAISDFGAELGIFVSDSGYANLHVYSGLAKATHCGLGESLEASKCDTILIKPDAIEKQDRQPLPTRQDLYSLENHRLEQCAASTSS